MTQITTSSGQVITTQQALAFAASVGNDPNKVAAKANELGLNSEAGKKFLAETFKTDTKTVANYISSNQSSRVVVGGDVAAGAGGEVATPSGGSAASVATQSGAPSAQKIAISSKQAPVVFRAVHGAGNEGVADQDIQAWFSAKSRTAEETLVGMVERGISAAQVGRALGLSNSQVNDWLVGHGLDQQTLIAAEVVDWTEGDLSRAVDGLSTKQDGLSVSQSNLESRYNGVAPLMDEARAAEDAAAEKRSAYDALSAKFEPAFAEYTRLSQELAGLDATLQTEQAQKAAAQNTLANLGAIEDRRDRRATAQRDAEYQIANADQKIADAQPRAEAIRAQLSEMESWGKPLMDQTQAAKAEWEQAAKVATEKNEIASAQGDVALRAADEYRASITSLNAEHSKIVTYLQAHPSLTGAKDVQQSVLASMGVMDKALQGHRDWTDAAVAKGNVLHQEALELESKTSLVRAELDKAQPARLDAEAQISAKQADFDVAKAVEIQAQADLDAAYKQRHDANFAEGKGGRNRARDEVNRLIEFHTGQLAVATQKRVETESALAQTKAQGAAAIEAGVVAEAPWGQASALSVNARNQALMQMSIASQVADVEAATQSALAASHLQLIGISQAKVEAVQDLAAKGEITVGELTAVAKEVQVDLLDSMTALHGLEQTAVADRVAEGYAREQFVGLQAQAYGKQLVASDLMSDMASVQQVFQAVDVATLKTNVQAAEVRLKNAQLGVETADMYMDWAEGKVKPKKQGKAMERAQPALDAAKTELIDAQLAYEIAQARLQSAQHLMAPLIKVGSETAWAASSAMGSADIASQQATTSGLQAQVARTRFDASDATYAAAQAGLIQATRTLGQIQKEVAKAVPNIEAAQVIATQAERGLQWADDYAALVVDTRQAQEQTRAHELALDALTIEAGGTQVLGQFLQGKAERVSQAYEQVKAQLPELEAALQSRTQKAQSDVLVARDARDTYFSKEQSVTVDFALKRQGHKKTVSATSMRGQATEVLIVQADPNADVAAVMAGVAKGEDTLARLGISADQISALAERLAQQENGKAAAQAHANPEEFLEGWQKTEMDKRKTMRKQLHLIDDIEQYKSQNVELQAARDTAMQLANTAKQSNQLAIDAADGYQANIFTSALQGQWLLGTQSRSSEVAASAADLSSKVAAQAAALGQAAGKEKSASDRMLEGVMQYATDSAAFSEAIQAQAEVTADRDTAQLLREHAQQLSDEAQAQVPLAQNAQVIGEVAAQRASDAQTRAQVWEGLSTQWKQVASAEAQKTSTVTALIESDIKVLDEKKNQAVAGLTDLYNVQGMVKAAIHGYIDKAEHAKEVHEDRLMADDVEKKRKKKALFAMMTNIGAMAASVAMMATGVLAPAGMSLGAEIALNTAVTMALDGVAQGINIGAGWQENFDAKTMAASASIAGFITIAGSISLLIDDLFKGTVLAKGIPAKPAVNGVIVEGNPLKGVSQLVFPKGGYVPGVPAVPPGELAALGGAIRWGTGAFVGGVARQGFDVATGLSRNPEFSWDVVARNIVQHAIGGALTLSTGTGQWSRQMHANFPNTVEFTPKALAVSMARRFTGTGAQFLALNALGLGDGDTLAKIGTLVLAQFGQVTVGAGLLPRSVVPTAAAQSLIRVTNFVIQEAVLGGLLNGGFDLAVARGIGRGAMGQQGAVWGHRTMSDFIKSFGAAPAK